MTHLPPLSRPETESARISADGIILQRFAVAFDYPVYFTRGILDPGNPILAQALARREPERRHRFAALVDSGVAAAWPELDVRLARYATHHADRLELAGEPLTVPGGETCKNDPAQVNRVLALLQRQGIDRQSTLVAIGGGALLDMAGYAASLCHRGVRLLRVPTTVLAQNDSGIGVKTAVNAFGAKNFLGTFAPPFAVVNDLAFLDTLPARDRLAGMAEAVKVAAIRDADFLDWLDAEAEALAAFDPAAMAYMIRRCAELHMRHIATAGDPFESGSARPLDFGHWAAHKLEMLSAHRLRHGEAVAIGMALDTLYAAHAGLLPAAGAERLLRLLERLGFRLWDKTLDARDMAGGRLVLRGLAEFREHLGGDLTVTLLAEPGHGIEVHAMETLALEAAVRDLAERDGRRCA